MLLPPAGDPSELWQKADIAALRWQPLEMASGDLLLLHPALLHRSSANTSDAGRCAYVCHLTDGRFPLAAANWAQPPEGERFDDFPQFSRDAISEDQEEVKGGVSPDGRCQIGTEGS